MQVNESDPSFFQSPIDFFRRIWSPSTVGSEQLGYAFTYDEDGTLLAESGNGGAYSGGSAQYFYLPTASGPMPVAANIAGNLHAVQSDHLNTPRRLTNAGGQVVWQWAYSAFGEDAPTTAATRFTSPTTTPTTGSTSFSEVKFNLRYPGQYADAESGLSYNYFRSYNPTTGRYTQSDPIGLNGGWNRFGYVGGNPISFIDPMGLATPSDIGIALGAIKQYVPEIYPMAPTSVTPVSNLSTWFGAPLQGYTDLRGNVQINANLFGDCKTPVDEFITSEFLQTIAHEWQHVQQGAFQKMLTHGPLHTQIDANAELIAEKVRNEFMRRRNLTPQDRCTCP